MPEAGPPVGRLLVVDDNRQVVGRHAIGTGQHDIVDGSTSQAVDTIGELDHLAIGAQPQRRLTAVRSTLGLFVDAEIATRTGIGAIGEVNVRRERRGIDLIPDLSTRTKARVHTSVDPQPLDLGTVEIKPVALTHHLTIPVEPDRRKIRKLAELVPLGRRHPVEVLHPHQKAAP